MLHPFRIVPGNHAQTPAVSEPVGAVGVTGDVRIASRVLIVDDHRLFRRVVREVLEEYPQLTVVGEAISGSHAVVLAQELAPDIVVLDMQLPDTNGIAVTRQLLQVLPNVRVVILTMSHSDKLIIQAVQAGVFGFLSKDIQPEALARAVIGVAAGEVAMSRRTAARVLAHLRQAEPPTATQISDLTAREQEVLRLLAQGATDRQIAERLIIAESTAKKHVQHILRKLRARNRAEAVAKYKQSDG